MVVWMFNSQLNQKYQALTKLITCSTLKRASPCEILPDFMVTWCTLSLSLRQPKQLRQPNGNSIIRGKEEGRGSIVITTTNKGSFASQILFTNQILSRGLTRRARSEEFSFNSLSPFAPQNPSLLPIRFDLLSPAFDPGIFRSIERGDRQIVVTEISSWIQHLIQAIPLLRSVSYLSRDSRFRFCKPNLLQGFSSIFIHYIWMRARSSSFLYHLIWCFSSVEGIGGGLLKRGRGLETGCWSDLWKGRERFWREPEDRNRGRIRHLSLWFWRNRSIAESDRPTRAPYFEKKTSLSLLPFSFRSLFIGFYRPIGVREIASGRFFSAFAIQRR